MWTLKSFRSSNPRPLHPTGHPPRPAGGPWRRWRSRALLSAGPALSHPLGTPPQAVVAGPAEAGEQVPFRGSLDGVVDHEPLSTPRWCT